MKYYLNSIFLLIDHVGHTCNLLKALYYKLLTWTYHDVLNIKVHLTFTCKNYNIKGSERRSQKRIWKIFDLEKYVQMKSTKEHCFLCRSHSFRNSHHIQYNLSLRKLNNARNFTLYVFLWQYVKDQLVKFLWHQKTYLLNIV